MMPKKVITDRCLNCDRLFYTHSAFMKHRRLEHKNQSAETIFMATKPDKFAQSVYRYFRYEYDELAESDGEIMNNEAFEFLCLLKGVKPDEKRRLALLYGNPQAGKTFVFVPVNILHVAMGKWAIIKCVTNNQRDALISRMKIILADLKAWLLEQGFDRKRVEKFCPIIYSDSNTKKFEAETRFLFSGNNPGIVVVINDYRTLEKITEVSIKLNKPYILTIDEAHKNGAYKNLEGEYNSNKPCDEYTAALKRNAKKIFLVTATPQDILIVEEELYVQGIVIIKASNTYKSIREWKFPENIDTDTVETFSFFYGEENFSTEVPSSFLQILEQLSLTEPISRVNKFGKEDTHPVLFMSRFEHLNEEQHTHLKAYTADTHPVDARHKTIIDAGWTVMTYNQYGIRITSPSLKGETIEIDDIVYTEDEKEGYFILKGVSMEKVLHWLAFNGGVEKFSHILIIAYKTASESITYCSSYGRTPEDDANWHLTHGYFTFGPNTSSAAVEQSMSRMCGKHGDTIIPTVYCNALVKSKVLLAHDLHTSQVKSICTLAKNKGDVRVVDHLGEMETFKNRIPTKPYAVIGDCIGRLNVVSNPDADIEKKILRESKSALKCFTALGTYEPEKRKKLIQVERAKNTAVNSTDRVIRFLDSKRNTKFSVFRQLIDPQQEYTKEEILDLLRQANYDQPSSYFHALTKEVNYGSGRVFDKTPSGNWTVRKEVVNLW